MKQFAVTTIVLKLFRESDPRYTLLYNRIQYIAPYCELELYIDNCFAYVKSIDCLRSQDCIIRLTANLAHFDHRVFHQNVMIKNTRSVLYKLI